MSQTAQVGAGVLGGIASTGLCSTGIGCVGGVVLGAASTSAVATGVSALSSDYEYQNGQRVMDSFSLETTQGNYNPIADATLDIAPNLIAAGTAIRAVNSATNSLSLVDDLVTNTRTAANSTSALSSTVSDVISGGIGGYTTSGDLEGTLTGAVVGGVINRYSNFNTFLSGLTSNFLGQTSGMIVGEYQENGSDFNITNISLGEINPVQVIAAGLGATVGNSVNRQITSSVSTGTGVLRQPNVGGVLSGATVEGLIIGNSENAMPDIKLNDVIEGLD